ncbi:MAG TPA: hypothetical protein VNX68_16820 [Nitrosopumilaceae archaeon]|nr:hypothetical protein [Nitrosopumilaceae archaeon]
MATFKIGENVRIIDSHEKSFLTYTVKEIKKNTDGRVLYLLRSETESVVRLYYESKETLLERVV